MDAQNRRYGPDAGFAVFCIVCLLFALFMFIEADAAPVKSAIAHPQYSHDLRERTFPRFVQFTVAFLVVPVLIGALTAATDRDRLAKVLVGYLVAQTVTMVVIYGLKRFVAWPRPDTGTVCIDWRTLKKCKKLLATLGVRGQFKSFPSGESAISACAMASLSMAIARWAKKGHAYQAFLACVPLLFAFVVAASRVVDRAHSVSDVTAGSGFGLIIAGLCSHMLY